MFTRTDLDISKQDLTGGSYAKPYPDDTYITSNGNTIKLEWTDSVPQGTETIWVSTRTFSTGDPDPNDANSIDTTWSKPSRMVDRVGFQVEFSKGLVKNGTIDNEIRPHPESLNKYYSEDTTANKSQFEDN